MMKYEQLQEAAEAFVVEHWADITKLAYLGFHAAGRGAVIYEGGGSKNAMDLRYVTAIGAALRTETESYDPETQVIFIYTAGDGAHHLICGHVDGEFAPPAVICKIFQDAFAIDPAAAKRLGAY